MLAIATIEWLFGLLVLIVFTNRYVYGSILRLADRRTVKENNVDPPEWPRVGIVVPVFCEGDSVLQTADSFAAIDYPRDKLKVLFIDDVSTDDTYEYLQQACAKYPWMDLTQNPHNMGKRLGIKNAVETLDVDLVMSVDSDVIVEPNVVRELTRHMYSTNADAVGGCVFVANAKETWLTRMQAVKYWIGYQFLKNVENAYSHVMCLSGCLTLYKRDVLLDVDPELASRTFLGDEVKYGEDRFLTRKIVERGYKTRLCFTARCFTKAPVNMGSYLNQQLRWRRSNMIDLITAQAVKLQPVRKRWKASGEKLKDLMLATTIDRAAVEAVRAERLADADTISKGVMKTLADVAEVLTPEQRVQLNERVESFRGRRGFWRH